jgi:hypothetical protein
MPRTRSARRTASALAAVPVTLVTVVLAALAVAVSGLAGGGSAIAAPTDPAPPIVVNPTNPTGRIGPPSVGIGAHDPGTPDTPGGGGAGGRVRPASGGPSGPVCRWVPAPDVEAFLRGLPGAVSGGGRGRPGTGGSAVDRVDPRSRLFQHVCDGVAGEFAWFGPGQQDRPAVVLPTPGELARQAFSQLRLPVPTPSHSPDLRLGDGRAAVLVGEQTWLWTDPARFRQRTRRVQVGPVWAQVTAVPATLTFDAGNGERSVVCAGPGTPYVPGRDRAHAASPTCGYLYPRSSAGLPGGVVRAEYAIGWRVSWVGSTGTTPVAGQLPQLVSRTTTAFAVAEAQALGTP